MVSAVNEVDYCALESLEAINARLKDMRIGLHVSEVKGLECLVNPARVCADDRKGVEELAVTPKSPAPRFLRPPPQHPPLPAFARGRVAAGPAESRNGAGKSCFVG